MQCRDKALGCRGVPVGVAHDDASQVLPVAAKSLSLSARELPWVNRKSGASGVPRARRRTVAENQA